MKKPHIKRARRKTAPPVSLSDVIEHCRHITTLAALLKNCERIRPTELLEPHPIGQAGEMIATESRMVEKYLQQLEVRRGV